MTDEQTKEDLNFGMKGHVKMITRCLKTGDVLDVFEDHNVFLDQGRTELIASFTQGGARAQGIKTIVIGDDVGTGTIMNPQPADVSLTEQNQTSVYQIDPINEISITYPSFNSVRITGSINGQVVMDLYPDEPNVVYTSATIRLTDDKAIAYRRFPPRTISALISVDIIWTLTVN